MGFCATVAFTPKGGCPLKLGLRCAAYECVERVAFTPKGGCPLKLQLPVGLDERASARVAFTPKGGCPLKPLHLLEVVAAHVEA